MPEDAFSDLRSSVPRTVYLKDFDRRFQILLLIRRDRSFRLKEIYIFRQKFELKIKFSRNNYTKLYLRNVGSLLKSVMSAIPLVSFRLKLSPPVP